MKFIKKLINILFQEPNESKELYLSFQKINIYHGLCYNFKIKNSKKKTYFMQLLPFILFKEYIISNFI